MFRRKIVPENVGTVEHKSFAKPNMQSLERKLSSSGHYSTVSIPTKSRSFKLNVGKILNNLNKKESPQSANVGERCNKSATSPRSPRGGETENGEKLENDVTDSPKVNNDLVLRLNKNEKINQERRIKSARPTLGARTIKSARIETRVTDSLTPFNDHSSNISIQPLNIRNANSARSVKSARSVTSAKSCRSVRIDSKYRNTKEEYNDVTSNINKNDTRKAEERTEKKTFTCREILRHLYEIWQPQLCRNHRRSVEYDHFSDAEYFKTKHRLSYSYYKLTENNNNRRKSVNMMGRRKSLKRAKAAETVLEVVHHLQDKLRISDE